MKRIVLDPPSRQTLSRLLEVKFYVFYQLLDIFMPFQNNNKERLIDVICSIGEMTASEKNLINNVILQQPYMNFTPTKLEIAVAIHYLQIPINLITRGKNLVSPSTFYSKIYDYIEQGQYEMAPLFDADTTAALKAFDITLDSVLSGLEPLARSKDWSYYFARPEI